MLILSILNCHLLVTSTTTKNKKVANLYKRFCKEVSEFRLVFCTTKVRDYFRLRIHYQNVSDHMSFIYYIYCNVHYMGRTNPHLTTRIAQYFHKEFSVFRHFIIIPKQICFKSLGQRSINVPA